MLIIQYNIVIVLTKHRRIGTAGLGSGDGVNIIIWVYRYRHFIHF